MIVGSTPGTGRFSRGSVTKQPMTKWFENAESTQVIIVFVGDVFYFIVVEKS